MNYTLEGLFGIQNNVIVVTGAAGGIGLELCRAILELGGKVAAVVRSGRSRDRVLEAFGDTVEERLMCCLADLTDEAAVKEAMKQIYAKFGAIDGLVNAAGMNIIESLDKMSISDFKKVMDDNFTAVVICCKYAGHYMLRAGKGRIVNISSLSTVKGKAYYTAYASSKAAVDSFTRALSIEWARRGINVNSIAPGMIVTDINRRQIEENPESYRKRVESIPRGCPGQTEWLVSPVIMLLSPGSIHLTGQTIFVDGGCTAGDTFVMETRRFGEGTECSASGEEKDAEA